MIHIAYTLVCLCWSTAILAQNCPTAQTFSEPAQKTELANYINQCYQKHFFFDGKGIVQLIAYKNEDGLPCWYLRAYVDDRYVRTPPAQYAMFNNDVILIYQGNQQGELIAPTGNVVAQADCLRAIVEGRLYQYIDAPQYTTVKNEKGQVERVKVTRLTGGNTNNGVIIRFNKDGSVTRFQPV